MTPPQLPEISPPRKRIPPAQRERTPPSRRAPFSTRLSRWASTSARELILVAPLRVPYDVRRWFEIWLDNFRDEVIAIIQREAEECERNKLKAEQTRETEFVQH